MGPDADAASFRRGWREAGSLNGWCDAGDDGDDMSLTCLSAWLVVLTPEPGRPDELVSSRRRDVLDGEAEGCLDRGFLTGPGPPPGALK